MRSNLSGRLECVFKYGAYTEYTVFAEYTLMFCLGQIGYNGGRAWRQGYWRLVYYPGGLFVVFVVFRLLETTWMTIGASAELKERG